MTSAEVVTICPEPMAKINNSPKNTSSICPVSKAWQILTRHKYGDVCLVFPCISQDVLSWLLSFYTLLSTYLSTYLFTYSAKGPWNKSFNLIFPIKYVIPKSLKVGHWLSQFTYTISILTVNTYLLSTNGHLFITSNVLKNLPAQLAPPKSTQSPSPQKCQAW